MIKQTLSVTGQNNMLTIMDTSDIKDNILRECYYHKDSGVEAVELRNFLINDGLIEECCEELIKDNYLKKQGSFYFIKSEGIEFVLRSSYSRPNMPLVYS